MGESSADSPLASGSGESLAPAPLPPAAPKGMVWVPAGVLVAGTPEGRGPRVASAEMPGEQVVMKGFFIDDYPYPNEPGAIPKTNVTQVEARSLCEAQEKRLCTELEWERACKGPNNTAYVSGDVYRAADCGAGGPSAGVPPTAMLAGCRSGFGVHDLHGGVWQWTSSPWGRGSSAPLVAVRGGNGTPGELVARCANASSRRPADRRPELGFRCCSGEQNLAEVTLNVLRGEGLRPAPNEAALASALAADPPPSMNSATGGSAFRVRATWRWHPVNNEELVVQAGCAKPPRGLHSVCGVAFGRSHGTGALDPVAFVPSGAWSPEVNEGGDPREVWVYGGDDENGGYHRRVRYVAGRLEVSEPARAPKTGRRGREGKGPLPMPRSSD